ncbi:MAG: metallopeptidase TldD-related protein [Pseudobdellovibrionaceae bacterium]
MSMIPQMEKNFSTLSESLFSELKAGEELNLNFNAEDSVFVRFNQSQVRQNTSVDQKVLTLQFQSDQRKIRFECSLSGDLETDRQLGLELLQRAREEARVLPADPFVVPMENRGESHKHHPGRLLGPEEAINSLIQSARGSDFVGLYASGPIVRATANSKGQKHWFSTESFFVDYSLFTTNADQENKAVKGTYADSHWDQNLFSQKLQDSQNQLSLMKRKSLSLKPGSYRTYFASGAVGAICDMLSWNALSLSALKKGNCAFAKLYDKEKTLSPLFHLKENFSTGLSPQFNSLGEMAPEELTLIEKGELKNMLVSSRAEKEYGVKANGSDFSSWGFEYLRAPEILGGELEESKALEALGTGLYLSQLHYLNWSDISHARMTGMTRYACFWVEKGEIVGPIKDLRFDDTLYQIFGGELEALTREQHIDPVVDTYFSRSLGGKKVPGALVRQFAFTL